MLWNSTSPDPDVVMMNVFHTHFQDAKVMIRERFECLNSDTVKEHHASDSDDTGLHPMSEVGYVEGTTWADRQTVGLIEGSLHYIISPADEEGLYVIDANLEYQRLTVTNHLALVDVDLDACHSQYMLRDTPSASGVVTIAVGAGVVVVDTVPVGDSHPVPASHATDDSWHDAHGANCLKNRHFENDVLYQSHLKMHVTSGAFYYSGKAYSFPKYYRNDDRCRMAMSNSTVGWPVTNYTHPVCRYIY